jgi:hypothetical protein
VKYYGEREEGLRRESSRGVDASRSELCILGNPVKLEDNYHGFVLQNNYDFPEINNYN